LIFFFLFLVYFYYPLIHVVFTLYLFLILFIVRLFVLMLLLHPHPGWLPGSKSQRRRSGTQSDPGRRHQIRLESGVDREIRGHTKRLIGRPAVTLPFEVTAPATDHTSPHHGQPQRFLLSFRQLAQRQWSGR
jgi:hypothetical protein